MSDDRWHLNKLGLVDFWFYTDEVFNFDNGHMMLRGSNGSGKSVTLQSFIPLLLDGNKASERLDPFGTRSRKLENYLLDENSERDDRIGYLYIEFKKSDLEVYKTIGMGIHARKNKPIDCWYFVIEDNQRINIDFKLINNGFTLTKQQLKNQIVNQVIDNQKEYMAKVNKSLFGFESIDDYKEMINLLLQLRTPKLSNSLKPSKLNEMLSNSLQPLSQDDLRPMSEAIANMDALSEQLEILNKSYVSAKRIDEIYSKYNEAVLSDKNKKYQEVLKALNETKRKVIENANKLTKDENKLLEINDSINQLQNEFIKNENEKDVLDSSDVMKMVKDLAQIKIEIKQSIERLNNKTTISDKKQDKLIDLHNDLKQIQDKLFVTQKLMDEKISLLNEVNDEVNFIDHDLIILDINDNTKELNFDYSTGLINDELKLINEGIDKLNIVDTLKSIVDEFINRYDIFVDKQKKVNHELMEVSDNLALSKSEYFENMVEYSNNNQFIKFSEDQLNLIMDYINQVNELAVFKLVQNIASLQDKKLAQQIIEKKLELQTLKNLINDQKAELNSLINSDSIDFLMDKQTLINRNYLKQNNIEFMPLYKCIEFNEINSDVHDLLEEVLSQLKLLNVVLIDNKYKDMVIENGNCDSYIFIDEFSSNFKIMVDLNNNIDDIVLYIFKVLKITFNDNLIIEDNYLVANNIMITMDNDNLSKFIGQANRLRQKEIKINELKQIILVKQNEIDEKTIVVIDLENSRKLINQEVTMVISFDSINEFNKQIYNLGLDIKHYDNEIENITSQISVKTNELEIVNIQVIEIGNKYKLVCNKTVFINRRDNLIEYKNILDNLFGLHQKCCNEIGNINSFKVQIQDATSDVDEINADIYQIKNLIDINQNKVKVIDENIQKVDGENIKERLHFLISRLKQIPEITNEKYQIKGKLENEIDASVKKNIELNNEVDKRLIAHNIYQKVLNDELNLGYVFSDGEQVVLNKLSGAKSINDLNNDLQRVIRDNSVQLSDYQLNMNYILASDQIDNISSRIDLSAKYQSKKINFKTLLENIKSDVSMQETLLNESDKIIFEDILVNNISKKIRQHIHTSKKWVDNMNKYMGAMDTSSGLKLSLKWASKKVVNEDEMDATKLIELLQKDAFLLKNEDLNKISAHFRGKIARSKELLKADNSLKSFHEIMSDVMDYRNWFEFKIMYQKTNESKKELTNNNFFAFSGGEKAMSMYAPLFSSVAAKFESANDDCPLIIVLDEAFAGVDERNINNMFDLISKFKFDFIMNSQVLWGDYASVKSLAIYELFRLENARYVTILAYNWNGSTRKLLS